VPNVIFTASEIPVMLAPGNVLHASQ